MAAPANILIGQVVVTATYEIHPDFVTLKIVGQLSPDEYGVLKQLRVSIQPFPIQLPGSPMRSATMTGFDAANNTYFLAVR